MSGNALPAWHSTFSAVPDMSQATVRARGVLDLFNADLLRGAVDVLRIAGREDVIVDLAQVSAIGGLGVKTLRALQREFSVHNGRLSLIDPSPDVERALDAGHLAWDRTRVVNA